MAKYSKEADEYFVVVIPFVTQGCAEQCAAEMGLMATVEKWKHSEAD